MLNSQVANLSWPYILISAAHILPALGFFLIGGFMYPPKFSDPF